MSLSATLRKAHRHILPFTLTMRLITLTSTPSVAAFLPVAQVARAAAPQTAVEHFTENEWLNATNTARAFAGVMPLSLNQELIDAAHAKATDMQEKNYWDHFRPGDQKAPWDFIKETGYTYTVAGENLARGFKTVDGVTNAWMASPTHRANLLSPKYTEVGFATIDVVNEKGETIMLTVQMFGTR